MLALAQYEVPAMRIPTSAAARASDNADSNSQISVLGNLKVQEGTEKLSKSAGAHPRRADVHAVSVRPRPAVCAVVHLAGTWLAPGWHTSGM